MHEEGQERGQLLLGQTHPHCPQTPVGQPPGRLTLHIIDGAGSPVHRSLWGWKCACMCVFTCGHGLLANR